MILKYNSSSNITIDSIVICNYMIDFDFLLHEIPELISVPQVTLFYGHESNPQCLTQWKQATQVDAILLRPSDPPQSPHNPLPFSIPYGVHHSKIFFMSYRNHPKNESMLRLIIHTANLLERDVHCKIQGAYVQDFALKTSTSCSLFEDDLVAYFDTYNYTQPRMWTQTSPCSLAQHLRQYDFSSALVALVPSTPGYHRLYHHDDKRALQGHLRIQQLIRRHIRPKLMSTSSSSSSSSSGPVVCQFSSMGSLTEKYLQELYQSMDVNSAHRPKDERPNKTKVPLSQKLQLVYPTVDQIRDSCEGYAGGGSVPGPYRNVSKPFLRPLYHRWSDEGHVGHLKTYYQISNDSMEWFVLTSHNLSKAAWGEVQTRAAGRRLFVRHWELGVWMCPPLEDGTKLAPYGTFDAAVTAVPLPYPFRPVPYRSSDQPWAVDRVYETADSFGRYQCE